MSITTKATGAIASALEHVLDKLVLGLGIGLGLAFLIMLVFVWLVPNAFLTLSQLLLLGGAGLFIVALALAFLKKSKEIPLATLGILIALFLLGTNLLPAIVEFFTNVGFRIVG